MWEPSGRVKSGCPFAGVSLCLAELPLPTSSVPALTASVSFLCALVETGDGPGVEEPGLCLPAVSLRLATVQGLQLRCAPSLAHPEEGMVVTKIAQLPPCALCWCLQALSDRVTLASSRYWWAVQVLCLGSPGVSPAGTALSCLGLPLCRKPFLSPALAAWEALTSCFGLLQPQLVLGGSAQAASLGTATAVQAGAPQRTVPGAASTSTAATVRPLLLSPPGATCCSSARMWALRGPWVSVPDHWLGCRGPRSHSCQLAAQATEALSACMRGLEGGGHGGVAGQGPSLSTRGFRQHRLGHGESPYTHV